MAIVAMLDLSRIQQFPKRSKKKNENEKLSWTVASRGGGAR